MVSLTSIAELRRDLADRDVLSVYVAAEQHDPTERCSWLTRLAVALDEVEQALADSARTNFQQARRHLEAAVRPYRTGFLPGRGWAGFFTTQSVHLWTELPTPMPDLVRWRRGPLFGPLLRTLKQDRPVLIALVDSRRARLLRYHAGQLTEDVDYRADEYIDDLRDRNMSKRAATRSGVRGETATDVADRLMQQEAERLLKLVAEKIRAAGTDPLIIIGGTVQAAAALEKMLQLPSDGRVLTEDALYVTMSLADIQALIEPLASSLTQRLQAAAVQDTLDRAGARDRGSIGAVAVGEACSVGQVELLLLTPRFMQEHEEQAETLIALVLDRGGGLDVVTGAAATALDGNAGGVAARLRFVRRPQPLAAGV